MSPFTACIVQTTSLPYDKQGNLDRALRAMEAAAARGASLILFPEMFLTGYLIRDQLAQLAEPYPNGPALTVLGQKAKALSLGVVMGMPLANPGGKPYNAVVMIDRDGTPAGFQAKTHFFGGEEKMFAPGTSLRAFDTSFGRMGILVCYDGEFPETARSLALDGAKLICMCAANMSPYEDYHFLYMRTRAMENRAYTLYCNYVGDEKRFHYCGQSGAFHPTGRILAEAGTQEETTLYALIDMEDTTAPDDFLNYLHHRQPQLDQLGGEVQVPFDVGAVHDVQDGVRLFMDQIIPGHHFLQCVGGQGVDAGQVLNDHIPVALEPALLLFHGNAGPVAYILIGAGQGVEQRGLAAVRVAGQCDLDVHCALLPKMLAKTNSCSEKQRLPPLPLHVSQFTSICPASDFRTLSSYPRTFSSMGSPKGATFRT